MRNLAITTILDSHGSRRWRSCGKLWAASLLRHQWTGQIQIHRNFPQPLFPVERAELKEITVSFLQMTGRERLQTKKLDWKQLSRDHQLEAAGNVSSADEFDWILLADADCIATRNPDHLFAGDCDLLISRTGGKPDPGFFAVRGSRLQDLVLRLKCLGGLSAQGLYEIIQSNEWKAQEFERGELLRPSDPGVTLSDLAQAAVIHFGGLTPEEKRSLAFAFHMMAVYCDNDGLFFDIMEA